MSYITTYTRKHFDPVHPDPERICIQDIAHALPLICRGNGHVSTFWSVGEHCICCAKEALGRGYSNRQALACLLHDASECYMSDVPRPLKQEMPRYREVEEQLLQVIYKKFLGSSLTDEEAQRLKEIDDDLPYVGHLDYDEETGFIYDEEGDVVDEDTIAKFCEGDGKGDDGDEFE